MKVVLISCVKKKLSYSAKAENFYVSPLFRFNLEYARSLDPEAIFILSTKYGLVSLDQELDPYNLTLNAMGESQKKVWAERVITDLGKKADLVQDHFIFLAGMNYRKYLIPSLHSFEIPLEGLSFGKQLQELKRRIDE